MVQAQMRHASARSTSLMVICPLILIADVATDVCSAWLGLARACGLSRPMEIGNDQRF
jgi:hypothetical protein